MQSHQLCYHICFNMKTCINFVVLSIIFASVCCKNGYYWRDWNGTIPYDAFIAADDGKGPIYFAQAYVQDEGLFVGNIEKHQLSIPLNPSTGSGPIRYSNVLKIFCASSHSMLWLPSNTTVTPKLKGFVQPVLGGITKNNGTVYIGRYFVDGQSYIGSIHTDNYVYFAKTSGAGAYSSTYEILIREIEINASC